MQIDKITLGIMAIAIVLILFGLRNVSFRGTSSKFNAVDESTLKDKENPIVTINLENGDVIKIELYPKVAPNTVNNFISLINKGFYDGLTFHRVIPKFIIQGGCPKGTGTGNPGYKIKGEFAENGFENGLKHTQGVISMARSQENDSAGSQFFIVDADSFHLDGKYAGFGKVLEGMDVVNKIARVDRGSNDKPSTPQIIKKITVETFGKNYNEPEKITE